MLANVLSIFLLLVLLFTGLLWIPAYLTRRATFQVIRRFYSRNALSRRNALTQEELDLNAPTFAERITRPRDYKPYAVRILLDVNVIRTTEDGKMYMDTDKLQKEFRCAGEKVRV